MATSSSTRASASPSPAELAGLVCRFCGAALATPSSTSACRRCARATSRAEQLDAHGALLPAARLRLRAAASWCSSQEYVRPEEIFTRVRLLLVLLRQLARARPALRRGDDRARFGLGPRQPGRRARQQRRLPAPVLRRARASPCLGIEPAANVARGGRAQGHPDPGRVLRRATGRASWSARRGRADLRRRQQRAGPRARPQRLRRRHRRSCSRRGGVDHDRVPAPAAADRGATSSTRSTTSTSPTSRCSTRRADLRARTASTLFDVEELPTHGGSLRIYARHAEDAGRPVATRRRGAARARDGGRARRPRRPTRLRASGSRETKRELLDVPDRRQARRASASPATARRARATRCSTTAASAPTSSTTRSTATRTSRAASCRARTSRSSRPSGSAETRPDYVLILPWNLRDEIIAQLGLHRASGAPASSSRSPTTDRRSPEPSDEGRPVLRRPGPAAPRVLRGDPQADGPDRLPADPLARDEVLRPLRPQGLHPLPGLPGRRHQGVLPQLRRVPSRNDFVLLRRRATDRAAGPRHRTTGGSPSSTPALHANIGERLTAVRELPRGRGDVPRQLRRRPDRPAAARPDRRTSERSTPSAAFLCVRPPHDASTSVDVDADGRVQPHRAHAAIRHLDQRRLLRASAARSSTTCEAGEELVERALPAADRRREQLLAYRYDGFWALHGHLQGHAAASTTSTRAATRPGRSGRSGRARRGLTVRLGLLGPARALARPLPRRPLRRHRDRLRRHAAAPAAPSVPELAVHLGGLRGDAGARARRRERSAPRFLARRASSADVRSNDFRDELLPVRRAAEIKDIFEALQARLDPDLVFTHRRGRPPPGPPRWSPSSTWNTFRDHLILEYEIPKWDGDLGRPNALRAASRARRATAQGRACCCEHFPIAARAGRWFTRGHLPRAAAACAAIECNAPDGLAEAFHCAKCRALTRAAGGTSCAFSSRVTRGYIGAVLVPRLLGARARGVGPRHRPLRAAATSARRRRRSRRSRVDLRDVEARALPGLRRRDPPGRALERPARRPQPGAHLRHQPPRLGAAGRVRARRPACRASCSRRRAASTAPRGDDAARRGAPPSTR